MTKKLILEIYKEKVFSYRAKIFTKLNLVMGKWRVDTY